jgi:endonuclease V
MWESNSNQNGDSPPTSLDADIVVPKQNNARDLLTTDKVEKWTREQLELRKNLKLYDTEPWQINRDIFTTNKDTNDEKPLAYSNTHLRYVAGMDISFVKNDTLACSGLFVFDLSDEMKLVYKDLDNDELINMDQPYVPGFLAYREAPFLLKKLDKLKREKPWLYPHCIFIGKKIRICV